MTVYLIECEICGEQYTGSTKTKFRSRANNYKSTQRKFVNKEAVPKQALKQKCFHEHYCSDRHNGIEDWIITLIDSTDTFLFFSIWVFFHEHSRITGLQGKGEGISCRELTSAHS